MTENDPMKLTLRKMLDLKVVFKCSPDVKGGEHVLIKESLIRIISHSPLIERMIRDSADSTTEQGAALDAVPFRRTLCARSSMSFSIGKWKTCCAR